MNVQTSYTNEPVVVVGCVVVVDGTVGLVVVAAVST